MPYQRAFSTLGCPELSLDEVRALAVRHQVGGVELRALGGTLELPACFTQQFGTPENARRATPPGPRIVALDTSLKLTEASASARKSFLEFVPWAEALGVPWLRVFDGGTSGTDAELAAAAATAAWWRELRAKNNWQVDCLVETHDSLVRSETIRRFLAAAPGAAILWDAHHTWKKGGEDPVATWAAIGASVRHVHVKDSVSRPSGRHPFTYVLPGAGEFPMAPLRAKLQAEFDGSVSLEWEKLWHPYLADLDTALATAARNNWW